MLLRKKILEFLKEGSRTAEEIGIFFLASAVARFPGIKPGMEGVYQVRRERWKNDYEGELKRMTEIRVRRTLQAMRIDGLVASTRVGKRAIYESSQKGRCWLKQKKDAVPSELTERIYAIEESGAITLIVYDIPHHYKQYRDWLRRKLFELHFKMLQKSVFLGKVKVPPQLIEDLSEFGLLKFVEIFEVTRRGTLRVSRP
jgi:hypothetical protein